MKTPDAPEAEVRRLREALERIRKTAWENRFDKTLLASNPAQNALARELRIIAEAALGK